MSSSLDPYAELASLFLTDGHDAPPASIPISSAANRSAVSFDAESDDGSRHAVVPPIEVALVGHLPVMGGLWLTQYADQVARREGPTALVRLERGQVSFELLRSPNHRGVLERAISVDEALADLSAAASRWIICPQSESSLEGPLPADALTLLTGGDDAATVAAYRIMKNLAERWHIAGWPVPPIGLVVLGSPPDRVEEVAEKLDRTTKAFLDVDLAVVGQHQRMDAIESAGRRTFQGIELSVGDVCRRVRAHEGRAERESERSATEQWNHGAWSPSRPATAKLAPKAIGREVAPSPLAFIEPAPMPMPASGEAVESVAAECDIAPHAPAPQAPAPHAAQASPREHVHAAAPTNLAAGDAHAPAERAPTARPMAIAHELRDLAALPVRCPHHADVELAVDRAGLLHLVVLDQHLASLRPVESWARAHMDLLRAACPDVAAHEHAPIADVVTFDAPSIVPLHGTGLRLHLLVETPSGTLHVCLNRG